jgi:hypothetical protein
MHPVKTLLKTHAQPAAAATEDEQIVDIADIHMQPEQDSEQDPEQDQKQEENEDTGLCSTCVKTKLRHKIARKSVE